MTIAFSPESAAQPLVEAGALTDPNRKSSAISLRRVVAVIDTVTGETKSVRGFKLIEINGIPSIEAGRPDSDLGDTGYSFTGVLKDEQRVHIFPMGNQVIVTPIPNS